MENLEIKVNLNSEDDIVIFEYKNISIPILYEDNHLIIAIKPKGVLSQEDNTKRLDMLTILKEYIKHKYDKKGQVFLGLIHRLDFPVEGVMVFSRTSKSASRLSEQIRNRTVMKKYLAITNGIPKKKQDVLTDKILKVEGNIAINSNEGKISQLEYNVISEKPAEKLSLLDINLRTGRTHQIRFQLKNIGCPIFGDHKYFDEKDGVKGDELALFSYYFEFSHPTRDLRITVKAVPKYEGMWNLFQRELDINI